MRLLLAARLSQDQAGQTGLDTQDTDARAWAERNGHEVIATAADKVSGRTSPFDRPGLGYPLVGGGEPEEDHRGQPGAELAAREG